MQQRGTALVSPIEHLGTSMVEGAAHACCLTRLESRGKEREGAAHLSAVRLESRHFQALAAVLALFEVAHAVSLVHQKVGGEHIAPTVVARAEDLGRRLRWQLHWRLRWCRRWPRLQRRARRRRDAHHADGHRDRPSPTAPAKREAKREGTPRGKKF